MTTGTETLGRLPPLTLPLHGIEIERPLEIATMGGLMTSSIFVRGIVHLVSAAGSWLTGQQRTRVRQR